MSSDAQVYKRRMFWALAVMAVLLPGMAWVSRDAVSNMQTSPTMWVPEQFPKRVDYQWFEATFETNDALVMSWDGCTLDDPRLRKLHDALEATEGDTDEAQKLKDWVLRVYTGASMVADMQDEPLQLDPDVAIERLKESLIGPDGETTCIVVLLTEEGVMNRRDGIPFFMEIAARETDVAEDDLHLVGPPVDAYTIDTESVKSMRTFLLPSMLLTLILCRVCLRSWAYTGMVMFIALFGEFITLTLVYFSGEPMNAVLIVMPPLVMVLTVSAAVHLVNYYHDEVRAHGLKNAAAQAMRNGRMPCLLATATTSIGLLSLLLSDIVPVSRFGLYSTCGIVTTLVLLFLILPGAMERWPVKSRPSRENWLDNLRDLSSLARFVTRYPTLLLIACLAMMISLGYGLRYLQTSVNVTAMFSEGSRILRDYEWFEKNVGATVPLEVTLNFKKEPGEKLSKYAKVDRLNLVEDVEAHVGNIAGLSGTTSAATFKPMYGRNALQARINKAYTRFEDFNYLAEDETIQSWRISGRVAALGRIDYGRFLEEIQNQIDPRLKAYEAAWQIEAQAESAGVDVDESTVLLLGVSEKKKQEILDLLAADEAGEQREELAADDIEPADIYAEQLITVLRDMRIPDEQIIVADSRGDIPLERLSGDAVCVVKISNVESIGDEEWKKLGSLAIDARQKKADANAIAKRGESPLSATYTGVMPLAYEVQRALLNDLIISFLTAVGLVSIVMMFVLRSPIAGLVSMLPNVFPMVVLFGWTSWKGTPIDIGSVMTASVALGIAVDDTLHFLTWFTRENRASGDKKAAVRLAFGHCAKAMAQTTIICGCGLAVYSFSWFIPTQRFAWMMITLLLAALVGDLLMLPAMLSSPVGWLFPSGRKAGQKAKAGEDEAPSPLQTGVAEPSTNGHPTADEAAEPEPVVAQHQTE